MATEIELERLMVRLVGDASSYQKMIGDVQRATTRAGTEVKKQSEAVQQFGQTIGNLGTNMSTMAAGMAAFNVLGRPLDWVKQAVGLANSAETMETSFEAMLGSAEQAKMMVEEIQTFAAATPLSQEGLQAASKMLLQFGRSAGQIIPDLKMLGDAASGDQERMMRLARAFGQMSSTGRLMGEDLNQMIDAGFNPLQQISQKTGQSVTKLRDEMSKGRISVQMVTQAFKDYSNKTGGMEKASKTLSGLWSTMKDDLDALMRSVGVDIVERFRLKELIRWVSRVLQAFTEWYKSLSDGTKNAIVNLTLFLAVFLNLSRAWLVFNKVVGIVVGSLASMVETMKWLIGGFGRFALQILALANPITLVTTLLAGLRAVVMTLFGPWTLAVVAVAAVLTAMAEEFGGWYAIWEKIKEAALGAWDAIKQAVQDFVAWSQPVLDAAISFFKALWDELQEKVKLVFGFIKTMFEEAWEVAKAVWKAIGGGDVNWNMIRDTIRDTFILAEFVLKNFGDVASMVWSYVKLGFVQFVATVIHFFDKVVPAGLAFFANNWRAIFRDIYEFTKTVFRNLGTNIANLMASIPELVAGTKTFKDVWKPLTEGFKRTTPEFVAPAREIGRLEQELIEEYNRKRASLSESFQEFKRRKLEEFAIKHHDILPDKTKAALKNGALGLGKDIANGIGTGLKEIKKLDVALFGSAESNARIRAFRDLMREQGVAVTPTFRGEVLDRRRVPVNMLPQAGYDQTSNTSEALWRRMLDVMIAQYNIQAEQAKKPTIKIQPAGLGKP